MSEVLQYIITSLVSVICTGGIGGIFYFRQNRKLKDAEAKSAVLDVESKSNDEWIRLYNESQERCKELQERIDVITDRLEEVHNAKKDLWEKLGNSQVECAKKDLVINELNWYRCEVNHCPYRKPPRNYGDQTFPQEANNPVENPDENCL